MKKLILLVIMLSSIPALAAESCSYCPEMTKLLKIQASMPDDYLSDKVQKDKAELVSASAKLVGKVLKSKKKLSKKDMTRLVTLMGKVIPYDYANELSNYLVFAIVPVIDDFHLEIEKQMDNEKLSSKEGELLKISFAISEEIRLGDLFILIDAMSKPSK